ncbi:MAG: SDR family NAD(P)-dependent oxidoreductase [Candidatus Pacebacteria bacterium]|nr:SDR family NAD(P)-dependent oxidoreductase [Candidatus Paceibacterota bacterium]
MKTALITGVSRGIGKALAQKFLAEGYAVIGTYQTSPLDYKDNALTTLQLDISSDKSVQKCAETIAASNTQIDILINNAGALFDEDETRVVIDKLRKTLEVNLVGTANVTESLIPFIKKGGHIVCLSSQAGSIQEMDHIMDSHEPYHYPAYKISKAALNMYIRTLAVRLNHENFDITVSAVHPGWVRTDMGGDEAPTTPEEAASDICQLAILRPETGQFWYKGKKYPW